LAQAGARALAALILYRAGDGGALLFPRPGGVPEVDGTAPLEPRQKLRRAGRRIPQCAERNGHVGQAGGGLLERGLERRGVGGQQAHSANPAIVIVTLSAQAAPVSPTTTSA